MSDTFDATWIGRVGVAVDRVLNVLLLDGSDTETVSRHAAEAEVAGKRWGCVVCDVLSVLVQKHHCQLTLDPAVQEARGAAIRAGLVIALGLVGFSFGLHELVGLI